MLACTDDYLAAERILDAAFLQKAQATLGEESLVVGIPARGQICATGFTGMAKDPAAARTFTMLVQTMFKEGGELGLSPRPFNGTLNSILEVS